MARATRVAVGRRVQYRERAARGGTRTIRKSQGSVGCRRPRSVDADHFDDDVVLRWWHRGQAQERVRKARDRAMRAGKFDDELDELERESIVGSAEHAAQRLSEYAAAGVQRVMLNHELFDDLEMLELLAEQVFPKVEG